MAFISINSEIYRPINIITFIMQNHFGRKTWTKVGLHRRWYIVKIISLDFINYALSQFWKCCRSPEFRTLQSEKH